MFERPRSGERAVLVHIELPQARGAEDRGEFRELVVSAGATPVAILGGTRDVPDARLFVGRGKAEEISAAVSEQGAEVVIFNHALSPAQERNLEAFLKCRVLDRIGLILDIFAQRASTFEGKLQVELAQLKHLSTRLVRGWTHLERQKGGIGLRGPGEKQLESDRRLVAERIKQINRRLERVRKGRELGRRARSRAQVAQVSLVGYTNAGKSTLFNALTRAGVLESGRLFATLDPTLRRVDLDDGTHAVLADTVGFIRHLPHDLVAAFRATLEETRKARLLLHVVDAAAADADEKREQVYAVLEEIGAAELPCIEVYNKIDARDGVEPHLERDAEGRVSRVWVSARTGAGLDLLRGALAEHVGAAMVHRRVRLPAAGVGRLRALFFELAMVREEHPGENGEWIMDVDIRPASLEHLLRHEGLDRDRVAACMGQS